MSEPRRIVSLTGLSDDLVALAEKVLPSTAAISGTTKEFSDVSGSGFLIDDRGHLVTNAHVVDGLEEPLWVRLVGSPQVRATVVGTDVLTDLAILRLDEHPTQHLDLRSAPIHRGELCLAFGSPLGEYPESISLGIVSGTGRTIPSDRGRPLEGMVQTDAAINPGNSGGPLVDVRGDVVGVNTCTRTGAAGISFAVPARTVDLVSREVIKYGHVERAALGAAVVKRMVDVDGVRSERLSVSRAPSASGLKVDDVLLRVDGEDVTVLGDLFSILRRECIDREIAVEILRNGRRRTVKLVPGRLATKE